MKIFFFLLSIMYALQAQSFFNAKEFAAHRAKITAQMETNAVAVMRAKETSPRNNDIDYPYRPGSDYFYCTGFDRPDSRMIIINGKQPRFILFAELPGPYSSIWNTAPYGMEEIERNIAPDTVLAPDQFDAQFKKACRGASSVYFPFDDQELAGTIRELIKSPWANYPRTWHDLTPLIAEARLIKSDAEIAAMQKAIDITVEAHKQAMRAVRPGLYEYQINALISFVYRSMGSPRDGFPSIVGSGPNSTILHYERYDRQMNDEDMLVMDIGAEYAMYSADVTRTIPVNGRFSEAQKEIYELVLQAQQAGIDAVGPDVGFSAAEKAARKVLANGLKKLGLITDPAKHWQVSVWMMHGVSHWLGLDTHDAGSYLAKEGHGARILEPGMVLTVEPGIYVAGNIFNKLDKIFGARVGREELKAFKKAVRPAFEKYKNIGVRIEDDILVTAKGHRNLSAAAPRAVRDIEKMMSLPAQFFTR